MCENQSLLSAEPPGLEHEGRHRKIAKGSSVSVRPSYTGAPLASQSREPQVPFTLTAELAPGCCGEQTRPGGCGPEEVHF